MFKDKDLQITIKFNLKIIDYLDILNLNINAFHPFHKPNEETTYIHVESNHPCKVPRKSQNWLKIRLACLSLIKEIFENLKDYHEQRLWGSEYNEKLNYKKITTKQIQDARETTYFGYTLQ